MKEEIEEEALSRNLETFIRFMNVAALTSSEIVNYSNIASDCGVSAKTVKEYFSILEDTLIGYLVPAYTKATKRKVSQSPKFYYFDVGVYNYLMNRTSLSQGTPEYGHAFEHFVVQEIRAYLGYTHNEKNSAIGTPIPTRKSMSSSVKLSLELKSNQRRKYSLSIWEISRIITMSFPKAVALWCRATSYRAEAVISKSFMFSIS